MNVPEEAQHQMYTQEIDEKTKRKENNRNSNSHRNGIEKQANTHSKVVVEINNKVVIIIRIIMTAIKNLYKYSNNSYSKLL